MTPTRRLEKTGSRSAAGSCGKICARSTPSKEEVEIVVGASAALCEIKRRLYQVLTCDRPPLRRCQIAVLRVRSCEDVKLGSLIPSPTESRKRFAGVRIAM